MKTMELIGAGLDFWTAKALDLDFVEMKSGVCFVDGRAFKPSTEWATGGPIIESEWIMIDRPRGGQTIKKWRAMVDHKTNRVRWDLRCPVDAWHESPLVAAMRAYVAMVYGDTVPSEPT